MTLVTAAVEPRHVIMGFTSGPGGYSHGTSRFAGYENATTPQAISPRQRLDDVVQTMRGLPFGGTDCTLPMLYAAQQRIPVDVFALSSDSETWAGDIHPAQALQAYRETMGIAAKLVVVGMVSNGFSIADPHDGGLLGVAGVDTATPDLIASVAPDSLDEVD